MPTGLGVWSFAILVAISACGSSSRSSYDCAGNPCDDGDPCNGIESCDVVLGCVAGEAPSCDDGDPCTEDRCTPAGCIQAPRDLDRDGHADPCAGGDDCAPEDPSCYPGASEVCNGVDDDCDGDVDEGLEVELLEVEPFDDPEAGRFWPRVILTDGTRIGFYGYDLLVWSRGRLLREAIWPDVQGRLRLGWPAFLADGADALLVRTDGPVMEDPFGREWDLRERIVVERITPASDPLRSPVLEIRSEEPARPLELVPSWTSTGALLAWDDQAWGRAELRVVPLEEGATPSVVSRSLAWDIHFLPDASGTTLLWRDGLSDSPPFMAVRIAPDGRPMGTPTRLLPGLSLRGAHACASPDGATLVYASEDEPGIVRLAALDTELRVTDRASLPTDWGSPTCRGRSVFLLVREGESSYALVHVGPDGATDPVDRFEAHYAMSVPSPGLDFYSYDFDPELGIANPALRRYGCRP